MKKLLFLFLVVFLTAYYFFYDNGTKKSEDNIPKAATIDSAEVAIPAEAKQTNIKKNEAQPTNAEDSLIYKVKTVESFTGYKIIVPPTMVKLGKETQAFGIDGKAMNAEIRLKDTVSGSMLIVKNIYPPYGNDIFKSKAANIKPVKFKEYEMLADTATFDINGRGQKMETPQKVLDVLLKSKDNKVYELKLKSDINNFDKDLEWFNNTLNNF